MKYNMMSAAALVVVLGAQGQALAQRNQLMNGGFEEYDTFFNLPLGWKDFTNPGERYRRLGDGQGPILVRTGEASIELASGNNFAAFTSDEYSDCVGRFNNPRVVFTDYGDGHVLGPDCVVSGWYAIPADQPLVDVNAGLKLEFRRANNGIFHAWESLSISGHTDGQWVYFSYTVTAADIDSLYVQYPPGPVSVSVMALRFGSPVSTGTIFWDDIEFVQGCPADINKDGFVDPLDYNEYINLFELSDQAADYNGDCFVDPLDYNGFINDFESGGC